MICNICLEHTEELIGISSTEGYRLNIAFVLQTHFQFCFQAYPLDGDVCRECWSKIDSFHQFYTHIEGVHRHQQWPNMESCIKEDNEPPANEAAASNSVVKSIDAVQLFKIESIDADECSPAPDATYVPNHCSDYVDTRESPPISNRRGFSKPKKKNSNAEVHECDKCQQRFMTAARLVSHTKRDHSELPHKCSSCVAAFVAQDQLDRHINEEHTKEQCPHCEKIIMSSYLSHHIKLIHELQFQIVCELCGKVSNTKAAARNHYNSEHMAGGQKKVQCDICGQWLKHKDVLRKHMLLQHIQGPKTCPICGKISPNSKALGMHKRIHSDNYKERFKCIVCGKGFRENTKLKEHSYIHSGVTDAYKCNFCDKTFRFGSAMYAHRKKAHPNEKNY